MEYPEWEPHYLKIAEDFGYSPEEDASAGYLLAELFMRMSGNGVPVGPAVIRSLIKGKKVLVVGPAAKTMPDFSGLVIAADSAVPLILSNSVIPELIVSDLDGDMNAIFRANSRGSIVLIHAHGDNKELLRQYVPAFSGIIGGTVQTEPFPPLMNFGGFTDGDRAVCIAEAAGAERIYITGFDFENPIQKPGMTPKRNEIKKRKLEWARRLISMFDVERI